MYEIFSSRAKPEKPFDSVRAIMQVFRNKATHKELARGDIISTRLSRSEEGTIHMIPHGYCSLHRNVDDLLVFTAQPPIILGISELFNNAEHFHLRALESCDCYYLSRSDALRLIEENDIWRDVARLLSYFTELWAVRDSILTGVDSYTSIRELLREYMEQPALLRHRMSTATFIRQRSGLSRSLILKVIAELRKGGYIEMFDGRLIEIKNLPERW